MSRWIKRLFEGTIIDLALSSAWRGLKAVAGTVMEKQAVNIGEAAVSKVKNILSPEFLDEQEIAKAIKFLDHRELQSWNEKIAYIDVLCTENGVLNVSLSEKLKDTVRRLTIRELPEQTAEEMRYVAAMPDEVWHSHLAALSLVNRFKHEKLESFKNWTLENAGRMARAVGVNRTEVNQKIRTTSEDLRSWVDEFIDGRP